MHPELAYSFFATSQLINKAMSVCWNKVTDTTKPDTNDTHKKADDENTAPGYGNK